MSDKKVNPNGILVAEYEYISQTAFQAHEDRARVTTFFLVSVGSLFGAFFSTQGVENIPSIVYAVLAALFLFLSAFGLITLLQLARLRKAWFSSAEAMNRIKEFVIEKNKTLELEEAFLWREASLPEPYKKESVAYLMALQVSMLGAITFGAMIFFIGIAANVPWLAGYPLLAISGFLGICFLGYQMQIYKKELPPKNTPCSETPSPVK